jgi:hypothetical protein
MEQYRAKEAAEREARRPKCTRCGTKVTDQRWTESGKKDWGELVDSHPIRGGAVALTGAPHCPEPHRTACGAVHRPVAVCPARR